MRVSIPLILSGLILSATAIAAGQQILDGTSIPYPAPTPGIEPATFLPGFVSRDGELAFNAAFSPDGRSFYFTRSIRGKWLILTSRHDGHTWGDATIAEFCEAGVSQADPVFAPDGRLFFISNRPHSPGAAATDFDIWSVKPRTEGGWSAPENATAFNSERDEYYISFARNGDAYFGSDRPGGFGDMDIYISRVVDGRYLPPENLGAAINTAESEHDPCVVSEDGRLLVFKSENRADGLGSADLYASRLEADGTWAPAVNLGAPINTPMYEYCAYITPDGRYFFYSSEKVVKWMDAPALRARIESLTAPGGTAGSQARFGLDASATRKTN